jgi:hypothetical protein
MRLYRRTDGEIVGTQAAAGKSFETLDVPMLKPSLIAFLNDLQEQIKAVTEVKIDQILADEGNDEHVPVLQAEDKRPALMAAQVSLDATSIEDFILNRATVAQCEQIFARLGTRFKEFALTS